MSSFRRPVGPQPPAVYWRRRAMVVGVIVLIVVVVVLIVVGRGNAEGSAAPTATATHTTASKATPSASSTPTPTNSPAATTQPGATDSPSASASASAVATGQKDGASCQKTQIVLKPIVDKSVYAATEQPKVSMSITNNGTNSCHMDLGSAQQVLTITSGAETYWSSKDCQTGGTDQDITLNAGQTLTTPAITWDRTRSSTTTCDASRPSVTAGGASYHLKVAVGNLTSTATTQFVLN